MGDSARHGSGQMVSLEFVQRLQSWRHRAHIDRLLEPYLESVWRAGSPTRRFVVWVGWSRLLRYLRT
eukprot:11218242-Lingulodinium_polyedra.AAC.1